jgi:hypothetical protein
MSVDLGTDRLGTRADDVYSALLEAHRGRSEADSAALNMKLVLILANLVGDADAVIAAVARAAL